MMTVNDDSKIFPPSHAVYYLISEALKIMDHILPLNTFLLFKKNFTVLKNNKSGMYNAVLKAFCHTKKVYLSQMIALLM